MKPGYKFASSLFVNCRTPTEPFVSDVGKKYRKQIDKNIVYRTEWILCTSSRRSEHRVKSRSRHVYIDVLERFWFRIKTRVPFVIEITHQILIERSHFACLVRAANILSLFTTVIRKLRVTSCTVVVDLNYVLRNASYTADVGHTSAVFIYYNIRITRTPPFGSFSINLYKVYPK